MAKHGNSLNNDKEHHLYAIHDRKEKDIFKYGISDKPIGEDGYSARMREQINYLNAAVGIRPIPKSPPEYLCTSKLQVRWHLRSCDLTGKPSHTERLPPKKRI
jgi:hypothetical protein